MNATERDLILQRWNVIQAELIPALRNDLGALTPKLERVIHRLEWVRIEEFVTLTWCGIGRPPSERAWLANAFVAKAVLGLTTTAGLIERLAVDRALRRICGFPQCKKGPSESTFSRAFSEFAECRRPERGHEALIKTPLGGELIGHLSRDDTALHARERPARNQVAVTASDVPDAVNTTPVTRPPKKGGRPARGEARPPAKVAPLERQRQQTLAQMLAAIPTIGDRGTKCNAQNYTIRWNGYKRPLDTADCGVPISALLSSASMPDRRAAIPRSLISAARVTHLDDVREAAYCRTVWHEHRPSLNHIPLIDHHPRGGTKEDSNLPMRSVITSARWLSVAMGDLKMISVLKPSAFKGPRKS